MSFDKQKYTNDYNKKKYTGISIRLDNEADADVIEFLRNEGENNKALICKLLRTEIKRRRTRKGWQLNTGDRRIHQDVAKYPYEVIEHLAYNDRYTIGFASSADSARDLASYHLARHSSECGPVAVYYRSYDPDLRTVYAVQVEVD